MSTEIPESWARLIFERAIRDGRAAELLECLELPGLQGKGRGATVALLPAHRNVGSTPASRVVVSRTEALSGD